MVATVWAALSKTGRDFFFEDVTANMVWNSMERCTPLFLKQTLHFSEERQRSTAWWGLLFCRDGERADSWVSWDVRRIMQIQSRIFMLFDCSLRAFFQVVYKPSLLQPWLNFSLSYLDVRCVITASEGAAHSHACFQQTGWDKNDRDLNILLLSFMRQWLQSQDFCSCQQRFWSFPVRKLLHRSPARRCLLQTVKWSSTCLVLIFNSGARSLTWVLKLELSWFWGLVSTESPLATVCRRAAAFVFMTASEVRKPLGLYVFCSFESILCPVHPLVHSCSLQWCLICEDCDLYLFSVTFSWFLSCSVLCFCLVSHTKSLRIHSSLQLS